MTWPQVVFLLLLTHGRPVDHPRWGAKPLARATTQAAGEYGVPRELLIAIAIHESRMDYRAVGDEGEESMWQILPRVHGSMHELCGLDPEDCAHTVASRAAWYLRRQIDRCGSTRRGIAAYNRGHCGRAPEYVSHVMREWRYVQELAE